MVYLAVAIGVVAAVAVLALLLAVESVRRLKALETAVAEPAGGSVMYPMGIPLGAFEVTTVDGGTLARDDLTGWTLVAALTPGCSACHARLPEFLAAAAAVPGGRDHVVALLADARTAPPALVSRLSGAARVVVGPAADDVARACGVAGFPTFMWVSPAGIIEFGGRGIDLTVVPSEVGA